MFETGRSRLSLTSTMCARSVLQNKVSSLMESKFYPRSSNLVGLDFE